METPLAPFAAEEVVDLTAEDVDNDEAKDIQEKVYRFLRKADVLDPISFSPRNFFKAAACMSLHACMHACMHACIHPSI